MWSTTCCCRHLAVCSSIVHGMAMPPTPRESPKCSLRLNLAILTEDVIRFFAPVVLPLSLRRQRAFLCQRNSPAWATCACTDVQQAPRYLLTISSSPPFRSSDIASPIRPLPPSLPPPHAPSCVTDPTRLLPLQRWRYPHTHIYTVEVHAYEERRPPFSPFPSPLAASTST